MVEWLHILPQTLDPIFFSFRGFSLRWYAVMYIVGFLVAIFVLRWRIQKKEISFCSFNTLIDASLIGFVGGVVGGWLGYRLLYGGDFSFSGGISGLSFHGALVGAGVFLWIFSYLKNISFLRITDTFSVVAPLAIGFGRVGNFLNGELYGRETNVWWGMDFGDGIRRHPSQLYEALFEGIMLFFLMWFFRNRCTRPGQLTFLFLFGYGIIRFLVEFFRAPDPQLGFVLFGWMTMGQVLSLMVIGVSLGYFFWRGFLQKEYL